ncbi:hypothetical protein WCD74_03170 [Actinomycetospora sp. OC33-EN08]|uniref:Uncharacterized protein n=1 Tax=Actinomycetospora aurantiaca TaxID=3129233 RepID=A0ABU8MHF2_9PSEU
MLDVRADAALRGGDDLHGSVERRPGLEPGQVCEDVGRGDVALGEQRDVELARDHLPVTLGAVERGHAQRPRDQLLDRAREQCHLVGHVASSPSSSDIDPESARPWWAFRSARAGGRVAGSVAKAPRRRP